MEPRRGSGPRSATASPGPQTRAGARAPGGGISSPDPGSARPAAAAAAHEALGPA